MFWFQADIKPTLLLYYTTYCAFADAKLRLNISESGKTRGGVNIGLKPAHDLGTPIDSRVKNAHFHFGKLSLFMRGQCVFVSSNDGQNVNCS